MFGSNEESHLIRGLIYGLLLEGLATMVIIGLVKIVIALINLF